MYSSMWRTSPRQWKEWFNKSQWSQREKKKHRGKERGAGRREGGETVTEKEMEDGNNSVSLETHEANLNLRLRTSSLFPRLVWPPPRPSSALSNQFNLSLLIPPRCSPSLSLSLCLFSPSHPSFITAHSHQSRFLSMTDGLCERSSKSSVRSSARVVKAERRAVHSGTCMASWGGDWGSQEGVSVRGTKRHFGVFCQRLDLVAVSQAATI